MESRINTQISIQGQMNSKGLLKGTITSVSQLKGFLNSSQSLQGRINTARELTGEINSIVPLEGKISSSIAPAPYTDDYSITPHIYPQILQTKDKLMLENVEVLAIPYYQTSNPTGDTVYIGGE